MLDGPKWILGCSKTFNRAVGSDIGLDTLQNHKNTGKLKCWYILLLQNGTALG